MPNEHGLQTPARVALQGLVDGGKSQSAIARELTDIGAAVTQAAVSAWCRGCFRPEPPLRKVIEAFYGIPEDGWMTTEERELIRQSLARLTARDASDPPAATPEAA